MRKHKEDAIKAFYLLLAVLVAIMALAGCGGSSGQATTTTAAAAAATEAATTAAATTTAAAVATETETEPAQESGFDPITLTILGNFSSSTLFENGIMEDPVANYIRENTGISLDLTMIPDSGDSQNRVNAMIAANDLPDIFTNNGGNDQLLNCIESDLIWQLDDLVAAHAPHVTADNYAMAAILARKMNAPDGSNNLYVFPMNRGYWDSAAFGPQRGFGIRWDLYKELGYPEISSTLDLCDVLAQMVELEPVDKNGQKTYGGAVWNGEFQGTSFNAQILMMGIVNGPHYMFEVDIDSKVIKQENSLKNTDSYYWETLKWLNKMNRLGILDPDSFTQTYQNYMDKTMAGSYMMGGLTWSNAGANNTFIEDGTPDKQLIFLPAKIFGWKNIRLYDNMVSGERAWMISKNCKTPERAIQLFDFMSTFEFSRVAHNGPEGVNWSMVNGMATPNPDYVTLAGDAVDENMQETGARIFRLFTGYASAMINPADNQPVDLLSAARPLSDMHRDFMAHYGQSSMDGVYMDGMDTYVSNVVVNWGTLPEELITYSTNLTDYRDQAFVDIVLAENDDQFAAEQQKFIAGLDAYKVDEMWNIYYENAMSRADMVQPIYDLLD